MFSLGFLQLECSLHTDNDNVGISEKVEDIEDQNVKAAFDSWKSKTYALTVPLRIVALSNSIAPSWVKVCTAIFLLLLEVFTLCFLGAKKALSFFVLFIPKIILHFAS